MISMSSNAAKTAEHQDLKNSTRGKMDRTITMWYILRITSKGILKYSLSKMAGRPVATRYPKYNPRPGRSLRMSSPKSENSDKNTSACCLCCDVDTPRLMNYSQR